MEMAKLLPTLVRSFHFDHNANRHRLPPRDSSGVCNPDAPFQASSYWFMEIKVCLDTGLRYLRDRFR